MYPYLLANILCVRWKGDENSPLEFVNVIYPTNIYCVLCVRNCSTHYRKVGNKTDTVHALMQKNLCWRDNESGKKSIVNNTMGFGEKNNHVGLMGLVEISDR